MSSLKYEYDEILKQRYLEKGNGFYDDDFPYSSKYPHYFKKHVLKNLLDDMNSTTKKAYMVGAGKEFEEKNGRPPKFLSIGSSSLFCYLALSTDCADDKEGADYFSIGDDKINNVEFEKKLKVLPGNANPPHMDAYAKTKNREYFFECKCHEMFDKHNIRLSKKYFSTDKDLVVNYIPQEYLIDNGKFYAVDSNAFGIENSAFDIKQFLTHLMGIKCNMQKQEVQFIYFYCLPPKNLIKNNKILDICQKAISDANALFKSDIVSNYCNNNGIKLSLYVYDGPAVYAASKDNVTKII